MHQLNRNLQTAHGESWQAELSLGFERRFSRTVVASRARKGPLSMQRAFYPEGETAHVYLLHPPGGVVGGDELTVAAYCDRGAHALLTTPAAGKFYRSGGATARQWIDLRIADDAALEWLPQETILFDGARLRAGLKVDIGASGRFLGWDMVCFGRPSAGERFSNGDANVRLKVLIDGVPQLVEGYAADRTFVEANWGLAGNPVLGTLLAYPYPVAELPLVQTLLENDPLAGVTLIDGVLVMRALGRSAETVRKRFIDIWGLIRPRVIGKPGCAPRIWAT